MSGMKHATDTNHLPHGRSNAIRCMPRKCAYRAAAHTPIHPRPKKRNELQARTKVHGSVSTEIKATSRLLFFMQFSLLLPTSYFLPCFALTFPL